MSVWTSNDWKVGPPVPPLGTPREWTQTAQVVIPCLGHQRRLEAVLVALAKQTYPLDLMHVIVVDDGSSPPLRPACPPGMSLSVVRPSDQSGGCAASRAVGADAGGECDVYVFFDADMLPEAHWLEAHMRWHSVRPDAAVVGFRKHVSQTEIDPEAVRTSSKISELFDSLEFFEPEWLVDSWKASDNGRARADDVWRLVSGGNLSVAAGLYRRAGGVDPNYWSEWGGEDNDLGYRLYVAGGLIIPERSAMAWHLGLGTAHDDRAAQQRDRSRLRLASRVPSTLLPRLEHLLPETPEVSLQLRVGQEGVHEIVETADQLLGAFGNRIGISIVIPHDHPDHPLLKLLVRHDSRIELVASPDGVLGRWRNATVTGWIVVADWDVAGLVRAANTLGEGGVAAIDVVGDDRTVAHVSLTRIDSIVGTALGDAVMSENPTRITSIAEWSE